GLGEVRHIGGYLAERIIEGRQAHGPYLSLRDVSARTGLSTPAAEAVATAGALAGFRSTRREAVWAAGPASTQRAGRLPGIGASASAPALPGMSDVELAAADVWATGVSPDSYPTQFLRDQLDASGVIPASRLLQIPDG